MYSAVALGVQRGVAKYIESLAIGRLQTQSHIVGQCARQGEFHRIFGFNAVADDKADMFAEQHMTSPQQVLRGLVNIANDAFSSDCDS